MGKEQRVYAHYKSLKNASPLSFVWDKKCGWLSPCTVDYYPHGHGHYETTTSNSVWLKLAQVHKMPVREIKDIVTKMRKTKSV